MSKLKTFLVIILFLFFLLPKKAFAQVVINEFSPNPTDSSDWIELYNTIEQEINLDGWILDDEGTSTNMVEIKEATMSAKGFLVFEVGSRLNKGEDTVYLINNTGSTVDEYKYSKDYGEGISLGRMPDGGDWGICQSPTKGGANNCVLPTPTPSVTPIPEPTATPQPTNTPTSSPPTSTPTPTPTIKPSLTPTKTPTPTVSLSLTATPSGEVLGEEIASRSGLPQLSEEGNGVNNSKERENKSDFLFPAIAVVLGLAFIGFSIFSFLKGRRPKEEQAEVVV